MRLSVAAILFAAVSTVASAQSAKPAAAASSSSRVECGKDEAHHRH